MQRAERSQKGQQARALDIRKTYLWKLAAPPLLFKFQNVNVINNGEKI